MTRNNNTVHGIEPIAKTCYSMQMPKSKITVKTSKLTYPCYVEYFYGHETINVGSTYFIKLSTRNSYAEMCALVGSVITCTLYQGNLRRKFKGYLIHLYEQPQWSNLNTYQLKCVCGFSLLKYHIDFCIYKNTHLKQVAKLIANNHQLFSIQYEPTDPGILPYTVQYNESSYAYLSRLINQYCFSFISEGNNLRITQESILKKAQPLALTIDSYKRADCQLWAFKENASYGNYLQLKLGELLSNNKIITEIRHYANNLNLYYYQYLKFFDTINIPKKTIPQSPGITKAIIHQQQTVTYDWDYKQNNSIPIAFKTPSFNHEPIFHFKHENQQTVLITHQNDKINQPYALGSIYTETQNAPFIMNSEHFFYGIKDQYNNLLQLSHDMVLSGNYNISFKINNSNHVLIKKGGHIDAAQITTKSRNVIICSKSSITVKCGHSVLQILPDKVILKSPHLSFEKPGIDS